MGQVISLGFGLRHRHVCKLAESKAYSALIIEPVGELMLAHINTSCRSKASPAFLIALLASSGNNLVLQAGFSLPQDHQRQGQMQPARYLAKSLAFAR